MQMGERARLGVHFSISKNGSYSYGQSATRQIIGTKQIARDRISVLCLVPLILLRRISVGV